MQDGGGGRKEGMSLGTIQNEFAMRFSVNQGFHCGWPEMSSLVFYSARTKVVPAYSHPSALKVPGEVDMARAESVRRLLQSPSCRKLRITSDRFTRSNRVDQCLRSAC